tara:strand:- start:39448 stop:40581 length:1134 start_codon:yes stop_codon:yes gene_type:complete
MTDSVLTLFARHSLRSLLLGLIALGILAVTTFIGARYGALLLIGIGFGATLEGLRFGFAGPWRALIERREAGGVLAQFLAIALTSIVAIPIIYMGNGEIAGAHAPISLSMVLGAFVFGASIQIVLGCGSGTLVNAGSGNLIALLALPFFILGSFAGSYNLMWWIEIGALPIVTFSNLLGPIGAIIITLSLLAIMSIVILRRAPREGRRIPHRLLIAAIIVAILAIANLFVAGQPWGVVYGLGLWGAKIFHGFGLIGAESTFWSATQQSELLRKSVLTDTTSLTNIGIILGAFLIAFWRRGLSTRSPNLPLKLCLVVIVSGFLMGYSARLAFGCNVGAFFSGISTGSLHGWVWFPLALLGCRVGLYLRKKLGFQEAGF